jgi:hypothetical protein
MSARSLLFVYAVDGDAFSTLRNVAHKLLAPESYPCKLCGLTYGVAKKEPAWACLEQSLPLPASFLHRDELKAKYPRLGPQLPVVLIEENDGTHRELITAGEINGCADTAALVALVRSRVESAVAA